MKRLIALLGALCVALPMLIASASPAMAATVTISNPFNPVDNLDGSVDAHGGGVIKVGDYYYWFGENRNRDNSFRFVSIYRSMNLRDWEWRGDALTQASAPELASANIERPKVIYNAATRRYVMWMHKETATDYNQARTAVASSANVEGPYTYHGSFRPLNNMSRDIGLYTENGVGYMYSAGNNNADLFIYRLTPDFLRIESLAANPWPKQYREAPVLFKRGSVYFMLTSGLTGWSPNQAKYATARSINGPWSGFTNIGDNTTYGSQSTYVLPIQGSDTTSYLYMGDRWAGASGGPANDSAYVWLPLDFPTETSMSLTWSPQISIDTATGVVNRVGGNGNYQRVQNLNSGLVLDVADGSLADGTRLLQWAYRGGLNQQWEFRATDSGYYRIVSRNSGKCIDVANGLTSDGATVLQWTCGSGANQQWRLDAVGSNVQLRARHSGKCMDVADNSVVNGGRIIQWTCNNGRNQLWSRL